MEKVITKGKQGRHAALVAGLTREELLKDPEVRRWYDNLSRGSPATGDVWIRRLRAFCTQTGRRPRELLRLSKRDLRALLMDFVSAEERRGSSGPYVAHTVAVVRSWLVFNDVAAPHGIKIRNRDRPHEETALSPEQVRAVLQLATPRERLAIVLMSQSGVRLEVLGNYLGSDGLRVRDLPEMVVDPGARTVSFAKVPTVVVVRPELSKASHKYLTFLGAEGTATLKDLLEARLRSGDALTPETGILRPEVGRTPFLRTGKIGDAIRRAFRAAGFSANRPYVLRTTFATRMLEAENAGKITHATWTFLLGHKGEMSATYTTNRGRLAPSTVEQMREAYHRCESYLTPSGARADDEGGRMWRLWLVSKGYSEEEAAELASKPDTEVVRILREAAGNDAAGPRQLVIPESDLPKYLADGWVARMPVNGSKFVVERAG
jgi:integrase